MFKNKIKYLIRVLFLFSVVLFINFLLVDKASAQECCLRQIGISDVDNRFDEYGFKADYNGCRKVGGYDGPCSINPKLCPASTACKVENLGNGKGSDMGNGTWAYVERPVSCFDWLDCLKFVDIPKVFCEENDAKKCEQYKTACFWVPSLGACLDRKSQGVCSKIRLESDCNKSAACKFLEGKCLTYTQFWVRESYGVDSGKGLVGENMPGCAALGECNDPNDLVNVFVLFTKAIFKYVGALAFAFFIFGGALMVLSFGNSERFKKGQGVLIAAIIGMIIVFSGYFIVGFLLEVLGVSPSSNIFK